MLQFSETHLHTRSWNQRVVGNRRKIVFGELAGKNGAAYLLSLLGLETDQHEAETLAHGLKELRMGDIWNCTWTTDWKERYLMMRTPKVKAKE